MFTYFCFFFLAKELGNRWNEKKRIRKTIEEILQKVKESIMIEEIVNEDIEKTEKSFKSPEQAVEAINNMVRM